MPRVNLTAGRIAKFALPQDVEQAFLWDTDTKQLAMRTTNGAKAYVFQSRFGGKSLRITIGDVVTWGIPQAREEARRLQTIIDQGNDPRQVTAATIATAKQTREVATANARRQIVTVDEAWTAYLAQHEKRWGARHYRDHLNLSQVGGLEKKRGTGLTAKGVLRPLLDMRLMDICATELSAWQMKEAKTRPNSGRQAYEMFRAFWRWCSENPEYSAMVNISAVENKDLRSEVPRRKSKKFDVLQKTQLTTWFKAVRELDNPVISTYLQALILTGARRDEMARLRWSDVDLRWGSLWVKDKVAKEGRKIPLTPYLRDLLLKLKTLNESPLQARNIKGELVIEKDWKSSEWVFFSKASATGRIAEPRIPHNRALAIAGLPHVTIQGLRRTFATTAEWVEIPKGIVAQIMGHSPNATAEKHYINRPLELLALWHSKYEAWILAQAGIEFTADQPNLRVVGAA